MSERKDTRSHLIRTALRLMVRDGYNAVGVQEICKQAGVNKGSFYHFFPTKRDLAIALLDLLWEVYHQKMLVPAFITDVPVAERFRRFFTLSCSIQDTLMGVEAVPFLGCPFGNFALELSIQDGEVQRKLTQIFDAWRNYFSGILDDAVAAGDLPHMDTRTTAEAILAYYEGAMLLAKTKNEPELVDRLGEAALHLALPLA